MPKLDSNVHGLSLVLIYFDQNAGKVGKQVRVRCTWISQV